METKGKEAKREKREMKTIKIEKQTKNSPIQLKNFELVDKILWCDYSREILSILSPGTIIIIIIILL